MRSMRLAAAASALLLTAAVPAPANNDPPADNQKLVEAWRTLPAPPG